MLGETNMSTPIILLTFATSDFDATKICAFVSSYARNLC
jgi:hypothetical protein